MGFGVLEASMGGFGGFFSRMKGFGGSGVLAMVFSFGHGFRYRMVALTKSGLIQELHSGTSLREGV